MMTHHRSLRLFTYPVLGALAAAVLGVPLATAASADVSASTSSTTSTSTPTSTSIPAPVPTGASPSSPRCDPSLVTTVRQLVETELADRVTQLHTLTGRVNGAVTLAPTDKATLLGDLNQTELPGIETLGTKVPGDTTCLALRQDAHSMVYDYRVYLVMTPQTDLVIANDAVIHAEGVLSNLETTISGAIQRADTKGTNVAAVQAAFADYETNVTTAQGLTSGQSATVLAQSPPDYPASRAVFSQARSDVTDAAHDLRTARNDLTEIVNGLS
jgi:hypothetical protein